MSEGQYYVRGRLVQWSDEASCHVFVATGAPAPPAGPEPPCPFCGEAAEAGGPDPCMGVLPGVSSACCGHGVHEGWIRFDRGPTLATRVDYPGCASWNGADRSALLRAVRDGQRALQVVIDALVLHFPGLLAEDIRMDVRPESGAPS
jgi:hypothetical protein